MTSADKLAYLLETKELIKNAIKTKGVDVTDEDTFRQYAGLIYMIKTVEEPDGPADIFKVTTTAGRHVFGQNASTVIDMSGLVIEIVATGEPNFSQNANTIIDMSELVIETAACLSEEE